AKGDVAGAAGDIEMVKGRPPRRMRLAHQYILPYAMEAAGHEVVHHVVTMRDLVEDVVDQSLLFAERNLRIAEMGAGLAVLARARILRGAWRLGVLHLNPLPETGGP